MTSPLTVCTASQTPIELAAARTLEAVVARYRLAPWYLTREVLIVEAAPPRSHPVLRLSARRRDGSVADELWLLACFIHEQCHWVTEGKRDATEKAIEELRLVFPNGHVGGQDGGRTAWSTYLHLIVCWLEYRALVELLGEMQAQTTLSSYSGYRWIYQQAFDDNSAISEVASRYGLCLPMRGDSSG